MALGLCCQWMAPKPRKKTDHKNILVSRNLFFGKLQDGHYTEERIKQTYVDNLQNLLDVLPTIIDAGIRVFRISSSMFPLFSEVPDSYWNNEQNIELMQKIGKVILDNGIRATTHPGQWAVISSDEARIRQNAIREIEHHAWFMDQMGLPETPYYSINIHGGKGGRANQIRASIDKLKESARARLTLENCELCYSVKELLPVSTDTSVPICFDSHHHTFRTGNLSSEDAMEIAIATWPKDVRPLTHLSNSKPEYRDKSVAVNKRRSHSDYIDYIPEHQLIANNSDRIDIDIEAKKKNLAIFDVASKLGLKLA